MTHPTTFWNVVYGDLDNPLKGSNIVNLLFK